MASFLVKTWEIWTIPHGKWFILCMLVLLHLNCASIRKPLDFEYTVEYIRGVCCLYLTGGYEFSSGHRKIYNKSPEEDSRALCGPDGTRTRDLRRDRAAF